MYSVFGWRRIGCSCADWSIDWFSEQPERTIPTTVFHSLQRLTYSQFPSLLSYCTDLNRTHGSRNNRVTLGFRLLPVIRLKTIVEQEKDCFEQLWLVELILYEVFVQWFQGMRVLDSLRISKIYSEYLAKLSLKRISTVLRNRTNARVQHSES